MSQHTDTTPCRPCKGAGVRPLGKSIQKTLNALRQLPNGSGSVTDIWNERGGNKPRLMIHRHMVTLLKGGLVTREHEGQMALFTSVKQGKE